MKKMHPRLQGLLVNVRDADADLTTSRSKRQEPLGTKLIKLTCYRERYLAAISSLDQH